MSIWSNAVITNQGLTLLSKLIAGNTLTITRAVTGAGTVAVANLPTQTAVTTPKQTMSFRTVTYPAPAKCAVPVYITNDNLATGYTARQVGVYATDPDAGEILFFIAQDTTGTAVPSATDMPGYSAEWTFYFQYGSADSVSVTVDPSNTVSQTQLAGYLPLAGGAMTGPISYQGSKSTKSMIRFLDNATDATGNGISIGGGGLTVIGGGESADKYESAASGGSEKMIICNDSAIDFYTNVNSGVAAAQHFTMGTDGSFSAPGGFAGNALTATKLATGRTIRTNLGSTSTANFDGSANVTPGVTGTLPVANGGTGNTSVDTTPTNGSTKMVTSGGVYTALAGKQATVSGAASTIATSNLTASRALVSNSSGKVAVSAVTATELGYLDGVTSSVQTQLNNRMVNNGDNETTGDIQFNNLNAFRAIGKYRTISGTSYYISVGIGTAAGQAAYVCELQSGNAVLGRIAMSSNGLYYLDSSGKWQAIKGSSVLEATVTD